MSVRTAIALGNALAYSPTIDAKQAETVAFHGSTFFLVHFNHTPEQRREFENTVLEVFTETRKTLAKLNQG